MKTATLKSFISSTLALAAAAAVWFPPTTTAQDKGATKLLPPAPAVSAPAMPAMSCPDCKSEYTTRTDSTIRGAIKPTVTIARHLCGDCGSVHKLVGVGKNSKTVTTHTCGGCAAKVASCCDNDGKGM